MIVILVVVAVLTLAVFVFALSSAARLKRRGDAAWYAQRERERRFDDLGRERLGA